MTLTSDEVNFLIYRYLLESGFTHSAFAFGHESHIAKSKLSGADVPPGALISFIQKGLQFTEIETHVNEDGTETVCSEPFSALMRHRCNIKSKTKLFDPDVPMEEDYGALEVDRDHIQVLSGHADVVSICMWSPDGSKIVSGSDDSTAIIWNIEQGEVSSPLTLKPTESTDSNAILCVAWKSDGSAFATASYSGECCIWSSSGERQHSLSGHTAPVSGLAFNRSGQSLLSASLDHTLIAWDTTNGRVRQHFHTHDAAVLDIDWRDNSSFASCSADTTVCLSSLSSPKPLKIFKGHQGDVNSVQWSPDGALVATCSDDRSVKVWNPSQDSPQLDLRGHGCEVVALAWSFFKQTKKEISVLASSSWDCTIRLWEAASGTCLFVLSKHLHPVTSIAFSPNREFIASGSHDRLYIWSTNDGLLVKTYKASGGINNVCWHASGTRIAASCSNNSVVIVRFRP